MMMIYIKMVAAVIMLAQPVSHTVDRSHAGEPVTMVRSPPKSSKPAPHPVKIAHHAASAPIRAAKQVQSKITDAPHARIADLRAARAAIDTRTAPAASPPIVAAPADANAASSDPRTTQQQVMAAMTAAELSTTFKAASEPNQKTTDADRLVAIVMARSDIKSVSDLAGKNVATDGRQLNGNVRTAIAAAGAIAVQLSENQTKALNRLIGGEVPAAVLTLVSTEAAETFPEIEGYRIFRIPLSPL
jgi:tRNA(Met) C34 N-acetyltransferase TmcA